jgi:hypothetical protein
MAILICFALIISLKLVSLPSIDFTLEHGDQQCILDDCRKQTTEKTIALYIGMTLASPKFSLTLYLVDTY